MTKLKKLNGHIQNCSQCKAEGKKVLGVWQYSGYAACDQHKQWLVDMKTTRNKIDDHLSEADYQTWMRL